jgi:hypothetical protein
LKKEITKWKEKHAMLSQYKREEDRAFKEKFEKMVDAEDARAKIKHSIIQGKFMHTPTILLYILSILLHTMLEC